MHSSLNANQPWSRLVLHCRSGMWSRACCPMPPTASGAPVTAHLPHSPPLLVQRMGCMMQ